MIPWDVKEWDIQHRNHVLDVVKGKIPTSHHEVDVAKRVLDARAVELLDDLIADGEDLHAEPHFAALPCDGHSVATLNLVCSGTSRLASQNTLGSDGNSQT